MQELLATGEEGMFAVIGADTMVVKGSEIFGKPRNLDDAKRMLSELAGSTHQVITGVSLWMLLVGAGDEVSLAYRTFADASSVTFKELTDEEIAGEIHCDATTVWRNRKRLVQRLAVRLYGADALR